MSVKWITWAWEQPCRNAGEKLTLIALADHAGEDGSAFPGCARLASKTGQEERTIRRHLDALEEVGWLTRERRRRSDGTLGTYTYQLICEPPDILTAGQKRPNHRTSVSAQNRHEPSDSLDVAFDLFWSTYRKTGPRKVAYDCWRKAVAGGVAPEKIQGGLERWMLYWDKPGAAAIKWPQGFLSRRYWENDPPTVQNGGRPRQTERAPIASSDNQPGGILHGD